MVCYDAENHDIEDQFDNKEDCENAGFDWVPNHHNNGHGEDREDNSNMIVTITSDGSDPMVLGEPTFNWIWIENLVGPVDGSDGMPVIIFESQVWDLNLPDWKTTDSHKVELTNSHGSLVDKCDEDGQRDGGVGSGHFAVYDSWAWSPSSTELDGVGWEAESDGGFGWTTSFDCANQESLESLTVTFVKTLNDYNSDNLEEIIEGPQNDWDQDVSENLAPECHLFVESHDSSAVSTVPEDWDNLGEEIVEHFKAPNGDHVVELTAGNYFVSVHCFDPDGDMVWAQVSAAGQTLEVLEESELFVAKDFTLIVGMPNITVDYHWDSSGGQSGSGVITIVVPLVVDPVDNNDGNNSDNLNDTTTTPDADGNCPQGLVLNADGTDCVAPTPDNVGDIIEEVAGEDSGAIPGFTSMLSVISMLGAVLFMSRRKQE